MSLFTRWWPRPRILSIETPKGPWNGDDQGGGGGSGPRNPWSVPPGGRKQPPRATALDDFLRKARGGGGGNPFSGLPTGPNARSLWLLGVGILLALWVLFTSFHAIGQGQRGVVTFFGRYSRTLDPGYSLTLPAPIEQVATVDVQNNRTENFPDGGGENLVLTGDKNIVDLSYSVRWTIASPEDYLFQIEDPKATVRATAEAAMREVVANVTLDQALTSGRSPIEINVQRRMQEILDGYRSGIRIQGVALSKVAPPNRVIDAFKGVTAAAQDAQAARNQAQSYAQQKLARAQGEATEFDRIYDQYRLAPDVTRRRLYYETMEQVLARSDKTVVEAPGVMPYLPLDRARRAPEPPAQPDIQAGGAQ
ncbi:protease modulator HflK [Sphingomonas sp.]|uniref:protease modulator HflK n=1 Tax=Sphingomonas sp. TaxID=28214 RepID=UPI003CC524AF